MVDVLVSLHGEALMKIDILMILLFMTAMTGTSFSTLHPLLLHSHPGYVLFVVKFEFTVFVYLLHVTAQSSQFL